MKIQFLKTHPDARLPEKNHKCPLTGDAGYDLFSIKSVSISPNDSAIIPVGLKLAGITPGFWFRIEPRSGLGFKKGLQPHLGIIDNGYRGDLGVKIYNFSNQSQFIEKGKGIAQLIVYPMILTEVEEVYEVEKSERGEKGFGSSDE